MENYSPHFTLSQYRAHHTSERLCPGFSRRVGGRPISVEVYRVPRDLRQSTPRDGWRRYGNMLAPRTENTKQNTTPKRGVSELLTRAGAGPVLVKVGLRYHGCVAL